MTARFGLLTSTKPPWLLRSALDLSELECELERLNAVSGFAVCMLDGRNMETVNGVLEEFARKLSFPEYFGFNSAAFDECLTDLSWLNAAGICLLVVAAEHVLQNEGKEIGWLLELLQNAAEEWGEAVEKGEAWDRPPVPFHVIFHTVDGPIEQLTREIAALPSLEQP